MIQLKQPVAVNLSKLSISFTREQQQSQRTTAAVWQLVENEKIVRETRENIKQHMRERERDDSANPNISNPRQIHVGWLKVVILGVHFLDTTILKAPLPLSA
ncbi:hypothetical protein O6H91_Y349600 [Diphasiastrum complanatum]|nr:hypothetical protein O6H91_Y349600 [Diphasiastrum complanatum]